MVTEYERLFQLKPYSVKHNKDFIIHSRTCHNQVSFMTEDAVWMLMQISSYQRWMIYFAGVR